MPDTTLVVACVVGLALLLVLLLVVRSRGKKEEEPRFEPPRELAKRPAKDSTAKADAKADATPASEPAPSSSSAPKKVKTPAVAFPAKAVDQDVDEEATRVDASPPSTQEVDADQILSTRSSSAETARPPAPSAPPPPLRRSDPNVAPLPRLQSTIEETSTEENPLPSFPLEPTPAAPKPLPASEPKLKLPASEPRVAQAKPAPKLPTSEPKVAAAKPLAISEPKVPVAPKAEPAPAVAEAKKLPVSEPKVAAAKPGAPDEHDFSALNDAPGKKAAAAAAAASAAAATVAKFAPPPNPATADLEKNDPRHAAARRLARVSVSEIKLYHEDEVKAGREANDLWKRLAQDIALAKQTFEARVTADVRDRFDYLLDEIVRQLAEGDPTKLGPEAPGVKGVAALAAAAPIVTPVAKRAERPEPGADIVDAEAPTKTVHKTLPEDAPKPAAAAAAAAVVAEKPKAVEPAPAEKPAPAAAPTGLAARAIPSNPETAELEKNDPRHAAARRLARLSVSEIKLYHEDEVKAGRAAKDLWKRMITDIGLATQTYDKRVDKEVRDRFDYLYDEIVRQLAEGDVTKLGPDAPKGKKADAAPAPAVAVAVAVAPAPASTPEAVTAPPPPAPASEPKAKPVSEPKVAAAAPVAEAPAPVPAAAPAPVPAAVAKYAPPTNPATAELEKNDPRHAAARRLARLSVSEIKLYHEDEVKAGRDAKDLWKRLISDIGLATQTYEKRVDKEVRERFDYLYDEILRQLAEGDVAKLGPDAPKPKVSTG